MHIQIPLRFELLHDVEEVVVDLGLVAKLELDLVQVRQCILHLQCRNTQQYTRASRLWFCHYPTYMQYANRTFMCSV